MFESVIHKYTGIPYRLHVHTYRKVKQARCTVVFLHGIGNSGEVWSRLTTSMPANVNIITLDLLGFGKSPRPLWAKYNALQQARAVAYTLLSLGQIKPVIIVGHSLGALTAVEFAKKYPFLVRSMVLCSPPFYIRSATKPTLVPKSDEILIKIYNAVRLRPSQFVRISAFAKRYGLVNPSFNVTEQNVDTYMTALEAMVINQTSFEDAKKINKPTQILRGTIDPFIVSSNLRQLARFNKYISIKSVMAGHDIRGQYIPVVLEAIKKAIDATDI
jgi:cis-3-alkyl-4-acyloxetan-2-one decarboxylase